MQGVNAFVFCLDMYVCMYRMINGRLEVKKFFYSKPLPVIYLYISW